MTEPKTVAGLHCFDVLEMLDDYVADTLPKDTRARVEAHLSECSACLEFGGRYTALVRTLHEQFAPPATSSKPENLARALFRRASSRADEG